MYARTLVELIGKQSPTMAAMPLLLGISITKHSPEMFRGVLREIDLLRSKHGVW